MRSSRPRAGTCPIAPPDPAPAVNRPLPRRAILVLAGAAAALVAFASAGAAEVRLTILHTTDLHGRLTNSVPEGLELPTAGLLRIATLVRRIRAENPNTLLVDCGDTMQGTPDGRLTSGRLMREAMRRTGYDAWLPGNHEFDWGLAPLREALDDAPCPVLGALNIRARPGTTHPLPSLRTHLVRDVGGVRVLIAGLTSPGIPGWLLPEYLGNLTFDRSVPALERAMPSLRAEHADLMVLMMHQGLRPEFENGVNEAGSTAAQFPEFAVILGGHSHEAIESAGAGPALYTQAGFHGQWLGRVDLVYDTARHRLVSRRARLLSVDDLVPPDPEVEAAVGPGLREALAPLDDGVGRLETPLAPPRDDAGEGAGLPGSGGVARLLRAAMAAASGAQVVLHGTLSDAGLEAGPVRERDLWRIVPFENRIGVARLNLRELRAVLEESLAQAADRHRSGVSGLVVEVQPDAPAGSRVGRITLPDGTIPHSALRIPTAFNSYMLASGGGRFPVLREITQRPESRLELTATDTRDAVRAFLRARPPLREADLPPEGIRFVGAAPAAPAAREPATAAP